MRRILSPHAGRLWVAVAAVVAMLVIAGVRGVGDTSKDDDSTGAPGSKSATTRTTMAPSSALTSTSTTTAPAATVTTTTPPTSAAVTGAPPPPPSLGVIARGDSSRRVVALTFDAGSDLGFTEQILDTLAANGIRATFGVTGRFADRYPSAVHRIAAEGHQIVNHTYDHPSFTGRSTGTAPLSAAERRSQLQRAEAAIVAATGGPGTAGWFRPPYGDIDDGVVDDVAAAGWPAVLMWSVDSLGWQGIGADAVYQRCVDRAEPGAIYLFHVGQASDDAAALQRLIDALRAAGFGFDTAAALTPT